MDRLSEMEIFVRVVESGSFRAAAHEMGVTQPTVSKAIAALEERLGVRLIHRTPAKMSLTQIGEDYLERVRTILSLLEDAAGRAHQLNGEPRGAVRVTAPVAFGTRKVIDKILEFMRRFPHISVHLALADADPDLVGGSFDIAIRQGKLPDSTLVMRRLGESRQVTVASPAYLEKHDSPVVPKDLVEHECIIYSQSGRGARWYFDGPGGHTEVTVEGRFHTDSSEAAFDGVRAGFGIGQFPYWHCAEALRRGELLPVLAEYPSELIRVQAVFPERRFITRRTRLFVDFLYDEFRRDPELSNLNETGPTTLPLARANVASA